MIDAISHRLFTQPPVNTLYHYTSLSGLMGIVESGALRASDIRYMNDSTELRHTLNVLQTHITERINSGTDDPVLLNKLLAWLKHPSFEEEQEWRAISPLITPSRGMPVHFREGDSMLVPYYLTKWQSEPRLGISYCQIPYRKR
ncbi:DUF2971 domain-containing protein [Congregibacter sp.]|uniref:DUF2971 domain-containing protein n=1 Tax=Congregibacter sp. TaxID=2744308 RepID=UPI003F6BDF00